MIVIRLLRDRAVIRESVHSAFPIAIGRSGGNDLILSDPSVSRRHARIETADDGTIWLRDSGGRNGIRVHGESVPAARVDGRLRARLGRVEIEIAHVTDRDTEEIALDELRRFSRRGALFRVAGALLLGISGWLLFQVLKADFWSPWQKQRSLALLTSGLAATLLLPILAFILLIVLRTVGRPVRFSDTLPFIARTIWLGPLQILVVSSTYYLLSIAALTIVETAMILLITIVVFVGAASLGRAESSWRFRISWSVALIVVSLAILLITRLEERRNGVPQIEYRAQMPLAGHAGRSQTLAEYFESVERTAAAASLAASEVQARQETPARR
jgi:hypothetical protein